MVPEKIADANIALSCSNFKYAFVHVHLLPSPPQRYDLLILVCTHPQVPSQVIVLSPPIIKNYNIDINMENILYVKENLSMHLQYTLAHPHQ